MLFYYQPQGEKSDVRSCYLDEILQESDKKSQFLQSYIRSYHIFFKDLIHTYVPLETCSDISKIYLFYHNTTVIFSWIIESCKNLLIRPDVRLQEQRFSVRFFASSCMIVQESDTRSCKMPLSDFSTWGGMSKISNQI